MEDRCKNCQVATLFPARVVALGVVYVVMEKGGVQIGGEMNTWVKDVGSGKVDFEDFEEVVELLRKSR